LKVPASDTFSQEFMQKAIDLSVANVQNNKGGPFAAIVVMGGKVIAQGTNLVTTSNDPTAHAEIVAIREACRTLNTFKLTGCDIYTSCEPCPMCLGAIYWARLDRIFFANSRMDAAKIGFDDKLIYREIPLPVSKRKIPTIRLMEKQALMAFREWERKKDKTAY
jgi:guanine deaminase